MRGRELVSRLLPEIAEALGVRAGPPRNPEKPIPYCCRCKVYFTRFSGLRCPFCGRRLRLSPKKRRGRGESIDPEKYGVEVD